MRTLRPSAVRLSGLPCRESRCQRVLGARRSPTRFRNGNEDLGGFGGEHLAKCLENAGLVTIRDLKCSHQSCAVDQLVDVAWHADDRVDDLKDRVRAGITFSTAPQRSAKGFLSAADDASVHDDLGGVGIQGASADNNLMEVSSFSKRSTDVSGFSIDTRWRAAPSSTSCRRRGSMAEPFAVKQTIPASFQSARPPAASDAARGREPLAVANSSPTARSYLSADRKTACCHCPSDEIERSQERFCRFGGRHPA